MEKIDLRSIREEHGLTQKQMGELIGTSSWTVCMVETNRLPLKDIFKIRIRDIFFASDERQEDIKTKTKVYEISVKKKNRVQSLLEKLKLSPDQLADIVGAKPETVSGWLKKESPVFTGNLKERVSTLEVLVENKDELNLIHKLVDAGFSDVVTVILKSNKQDFTTLAKRCLCGLKATLPEEDVSVVQSTFMKDIRIDFNFTHKEFAILFEETITSIKNMESKKTPVSKQILKACKYLKSIRDDDNKDELLKIYGWIIHKNWAVMSEYLKDIIED